VVRHGRVDSREVHLARSWLERLGVAAEAEDRRRPEPSAASHPGAQAERVEPPPSEVRQARSGPSPAQQAAVLASQGDYKEAARLYYEALRETLQAAPDDLLLWYAMGVTLSHLGRKWEAAEAFRHLVRHGRPDSKEVRLAQLWLERGEVPADPTGVEPPRARPPADPAPRTETRPVEARRKPPTRPPVVEDEFGSYEAAPVVPPQPRARRASPPDAPEVRVKPSPPAPAPQGGGRAVPARRRRGVGPSPGEQAALLAAQGNYAEAASLYAEAVRAKPEDPILWYALGVTLRRLNRPQEAAEALERVVRHGEPESLVRLARLWLERGGVGAERVDDAGGGSPRKGRPRRGDSDRD
jgi:tetratricopeptide (TPR) repeat protein